MSPERPAFLAWVEQQAARGTPYCWPAESNGYLGKGLQHPEAPEALDCSGTVTCGLYNATGGRLDWRAAYSTRLLWKELKPVEQPRPGDLAFYGSLTTGSALMHGHVMVLAADGIRVVGASGGGPLTDSIERARRHGARVRFQPNHLYRKDFQGWRALPLD